jgi:hypothetical protein
MRKRLTLRASAGAAAVLTALAGAATARAIPASTAPRWHLVYRSHYAPGDSFETITAPARDDAWVWGTTSLQSGAKTEYLHWDGRSWRSVAIKGISSFTPRALASSSPGNVWFFGADPLFRPEVLIYNGKTWRLRSAPGISNWGNVAVLSAANVWNAGLEGSCLARPPAMCTTLDHWNGTTWSSVKVPGMVVSVTKARGHAWFLALTKVGGPTDDHNGIPVIYEAAGNRLRTVSAPASRLTEEASLAVAPNGHLWLQGFLPAKGRPARMWQSSGSRWTRLATPSYLCRVGLNGCGLIMDGPLTYDGASGVWAGPLVHWTGRRWIDAENYFPQLAPGFNFNAFTLFPGTTGIWAVGNIATSAPEGDNGLIARYY